MWTSSDRDKATDPNRSDRLTEHEKTMLTQATSQAGSWGQKAKEALDRDKNR